jgi:hypothetical protein
MDRAHITTPPTTAARVVKLGYYSNSQNGVIVSRHGIAPCVCGGGKGHDTDVPKILIEYETTITL